MRGSVAEAASDSLGKLSRVGVPCLRRFGEHEKTGDGCPVPVQLLWFRRLLLPAGCDAIGGRRLRQIAARICHEGFMILPRRKHEEVARVFREEPAFDRLLSPDELHRITPTECDGISFRIFDKRLLCSFSGEIVDPSSMCR